MMNIAHCIKPEINVLKLADLHPDPDQPREYFDPDKLDELKASIQANGIITPLLYRVENGKNIIVSGEYRYKAATELNLPEVPAQQVLKDYQIVALSENMQRNTLLAMEEARGVKRLLDSGMDRKQLEEKLGKAESTISEMLKPTELPEDMQKAALTSVFWSRNKLLTLAKVKDKKEQKIAFEKMEVTVARKEKEKERKRAERLTGQKDATDNEKSTPLGKSTKDRIKGFKSSIDALGEKIKKGIPKNFDAKDQKRLRKELQALVETINAFLSKEPVQGESDKV